MTIDFPLRIYISCSWKGDLDDERAVVEDLVRKDLLMHPVYGRSSELDIVSDYLMRLSDCDIAIVLLGSKYSKHVEKEFIYALNVYEIPTLVFKKNCEREKRLQDKIDSIYHYTSITPFKNKSEFKKVVKERIIELVGRRYKMQLQIEKTIKQMIGSQIMVNYPKVPETEYKEREGRIDRRE